MNVDLLQRLAEAGTPLALVAEVAAELAKAKHLRGPVIVDDISAAKYPTGPIERWGYEGLITPRLPDKEWWPLRNSIIREADGICHYCGDANESMCADHVVPLSRGGTNNRDNLVCCCLPCNSSKADRLLSEWKGRYQ